MNVTDNFCDITPSEYIMSPIRVTRARRINVPFFFLIFLSTYHRHSSRGICRCWKSPCRLPCRCVPSAYPSSKGEHVLAAPPDVSCFSRVYYQTREVALVLVVAMVCTSVILERTHSCRRNTSL